MPAETITVTLAGASHCLPAATTLSQLVASLGHAPNAVATAVNGAFVPRDQRAQRQLEDDDAVLLFQPIVGG